MINFNNKIMGLAAMMWVLALAGTVQAPAQAQDGPAGEHAKGQDQPVPAARLFETADANGDGLISRAEFDAARAAHFSNMDANGDGIVEGPEFRDNVRVTTDARREELQARIEAAEHPRRAARQARGRTGRHSRRQFAHWDANNDRQISADEFDVAGKRAFRNFDADADGSITLTEAQFVRQQRHMMMRDRERGPEANQHGRGHGQGTRRRGGR